MSNELSINLSKPGSKFLTGLAARKAAQLVKSGLPEEVSPASLEYRIGIIFDDSGSMYGQIQDAHMGCEEFLRSCEKDKTAVAIYPLNAPKLLLCSNLPAVALMIKQVRATGGTPLVQKLTEMFHDNSLTRAIVFSDGSPNSYTPEMYEEIIGKGISVDTVYIPDSYCEPHAEEFMQKLAADTKGIYLKFEKGKSNFRTAFKYLSPGLRYMLADKSFADKLQGK